MVGRGNYRRCLLGGDGLPASACRSEELVLRGASAGKQGCKARPRMATIPLTIRLVNSYDPTHDPTMSPSVQETSVE
jgi:hypothetical protein